MADRKTFGHLSYRVTTRRQSFSHAARKIGPDGISLTERGKGTNTRYINDIAMEGEDYCNSLLVTEVFTPAGHGSSYPSHRHDEDDFLRITYLEETYYHRLNPAQGFGRVYHQPDPERG